jgi:hypothetical protein
MVTKTTLVLLTLLLTAGLADASGVHFGVKAGMVISSQDFEYENLAPPDFDNHIGPQAGVFVELAINKYLSVMPQVHYVPKGLKANLVEVTPTHPQGTGRTLSFKPRVDYVSLPILLRAYIPGRAVSPGFLLGPRLDIKIGSKPEGFDLIYEKLKNTTFGFTTGIGLNIHATESRDFLLEVTWHPDLTHAVDMVNLEGNRVTVDNSAVSFLVGMRF